jgi:hypothetical protein
VCVKLKCVIAFNVNVVYNFFGENVVNILFGGKGKDTFGGNWKRILVERGKVHFWRKRVSCNWLYMLRAMFILPGYYVLPNYDGNVGKIIYN